MTPEQHRTIEWHCQRLIVEYANLVDQQRWDDVAACYLEDGRMMRPSAPGQPIVGRRAILAALRTRPADRITKHICGNVVVTPEALEEATAYSAYAIYSGTRGPDGALPRIDAGPPVICEFRDRLQLTPDGWRFAERIGILVFAPA